MEKVQKYERHLMDAFAFDAGDLAVNRAGTFSENQRRKLQHWWMIWTLGLAAALIVGAGVSAFLVPAILLAPQALGIKIAVGLVAIILTCVALYAFCWFKRADYLSDLDESIVYAAEGRVRLALDEGRSNARYLVSVGHLAFIVSKGAFLAFKNGDPYRIYYAPNSKRIVSVEWLRGEDNLLRPGDEAFEDELDNWFDLKAG